MKKFDGVGLVGGEKLTTEPSHVAAFVCYFFFGSKISFNFATVAGFKS